MSEAKDKMELKDKILYAAYGKASVTPGCIDGDSDAIQTAITALHNEGLVKIGGRGSHGGKSAILNFEITEKGAELVDNGGYSKRQKAERRRRLSRKAWAAIGAVGGSVLTELIHILVERLAK